jgi:glycosyltransferase involved in cell wall biosynthesis
MEPLFRRRWDHVVEIPNGVDADLFHPALDGSSVRNQHGIPDGADILLFVGALDRAHHFKGVSHLLRVFSRIEGEESVLLIVGDGDLREHFGALADELRIAHRVCFVGAVPHRLLGPYYASASFLVLPSFPPESFGVVLIEAMACGKPVVASDLPGVRSVVSDGQDGLLVRPGDAGDLAAKMQQLLCDPGRRQEMGRQGRVKVETKYAWSQIIPRLEQVYQTALAENTVCFT